jgi:hypothetical protein
MDSALRDYPELVKEYFGTLIPSNDNKFAALNMAVWSGGAFIYVPPGVQVDIPLQAYFRINAENMGQFERTLIIADEGSYVHYVEGCSAPIYSSDSLHSAVVEIVAKKGKIDVIFANAAFVEKTMTATATPEHFDNTFNTNARGTYFTVQKALPYLNDRASIILVASAGLTAAAALPQLAFGQSKEPPFKISLAEWSLHRTLKEGKLDNRDFAKTAKQDYGIEAIEYVNQFWMDKAQDKAYVAELKKRSEDLGVKTMLIMCDNEGNLGDSDDAKRTKSVENHYKWVEAAKELGCHSIRVNARSNAKLTPEDRACLCFIHLDNDRPEDVRPKALRRDGLRLGERLWTGKACGPERDLAGRRHS